MDKFDRLIEWKRLRTSEELCRPLYCLQTTFYLLNWLQLCQRNNMSAYFWRITCFFFACCEWDVTRRRLSIQIECVTGSDIVELKSSINICNVLRDVCVCPGRDTNDEVKKVTEKMKKMTSKRCYGYNNNCTSNRFQRNQLLEMWNSYKQTFCHISSSSVGHEWNKRENDRENGKN